MIRDSRGKRVGIEEAFHLHRDLIKEKGILDGEWDRLSKCFGGAKKSTVIEDLVAIDVQVVHAGSEGCPVSHVDICRFVRSIASDGSYEVAACANGSQLASFETGHAGAGASIASRGSTRETYQDALKYPPNDPYFIDQEILFEALRIREAWGAVRQSGPPRRDVVVAILDSGITPGHPEFEGKVLEGFDASWSWKKSVEDHHGHGTAMAGILGANINNGIGMAGIADKVRIFPIRMSQGRSDPDYAAILRAWDAAQNSEATEVILFACGGEFDQETALLYKAVLNRAVAKGIVVLTPTANSDDTNSLDELRLPCSLANSLPGVLCVAATVATEPVILTTATSKLASFGVPSTDVVVPTRKYDGDHWVYGKSWGSSAAAAAAAGIVVLMKSFKNFTPQEIERILLNSTEGRVRTKAGDEMSYGLLRPDVAIKQAIAEASWARVN
ncbi:hypothetical protein FOZ61_009685 [Perkinsus olseni]|uniref:subtilisin n=1 Tax=Perkinsus olseni TaxID=32597 RepID=A0A7J6LW39_PEROL|nr:hypothetical protein FOZ61_009685 [Perkinsus olseni]KAF4663518.1 hypothetical protein FOL46_004710 [Perkinsus olseni]